MASISNLQESLTINFGVAAVGNFPSGGPGGSGSSLSLGTIRMYGFNFLPGGVADTNGGLLPISSNSALFSLMGITHGGDGRTTFAMPDLENNLAVGQGTGPGLTPRPNGDVFGNDLIEIETLNLPAEVGGGAQPVNNVETSTSIIWAINTGGYFPSSAAEPTPRPAFSARYRPSRSGATATCPPDGPRQKARSFPSARTRRCSRFSA